MDTKALALATGHVFRGSCDDVSQLPEDAEPGYIYYIGDDVYIFTAERTWSLFGAATHDSVSVVEKTLNDFEGVRIFFRLPNHSRIVTDYNYAHPVQDRESVEVLRKRLEESWPNCGFVIMDGRSTWDHTKCMTMGQLRNSYLMSRTPE